MSDFIKYETGKDPNYFFQEFINLNFVKSLNKIIQNEDKKNSASSLNKNETVDFGKEFCDTVAFCFPKFKEVK